MLSVALMPHTDRIPTKVIEQYSIQSMFQAADNGAKAALSWTQLTCMITHTNTYIHAYIHEHTHTNTSASLLSMVYLWPGCSRYHPAHTHTSRHTHTSNACLHMIVHLWVHTAAHAASGPCHPNATSFGRNRSVTLWGVLTTPNVSHALLHTNVYVHHLPFIQTQIIAALVNEYVAIG